MSLCWCSDCSVSPPPIGLLSTVYWSTIRLLNPEDCRGKSGRKDYFMHLLYSRILKYIWLQIYPYQLQPLQCQCQISKCGNHSNVRRHLALRGLAVLRGGGEGDQGAGSRPAPRHQQVTGGAGGGRVLCSSSGLTGQCWSPRSPMSRAAV